MSALAPTPPDRLVDARGRAYFLWDDDLTLDAFRARLRDPDPDVRAYFLGKLMRQAKPDDVFSFVTLRELGEQLDAVEPYLGRTRPFWRWLLEQWGITDSTRSDRSGGVTSVANANQSPDCTPAVAGVTATGIVHGNTITLDAAVPELQGRRVRLTIELADDDVQLSRDQHMSAWAQWVERGPSGPIDDDG